MDGNSDNTPAPTGSINWGHLEAAINSTRAAARVVLVMVDEALDARHPDKAAHKHDGGFALLLDRVTFLGLNHSVIILLRNTHELAEAFDAVAKPPG